MIFGRSLPDMGARQLVEVENDRLVDAVEIHIEEEIIVDNQSLLECSVKELKRMGFEKQSFGQLPRVTRW